MIKINGYDDAILGMDWRDRLVYSIEKMIEITCERDGMSEDDALEYHCFNTFDSYLGEHTPIFVYLCSEGTR